LKKLDVNYSNPEFGLGFAVSIKTINFRDEGTKRYTKNVKRADGELRAEAQDCHTRQPYAFLAAIVLLPKDAALDGVDTYSSLKHAWQVYRKRAGRRQTTDDPSLFEIVYLGTYETSAKSFGNVSFFEMGTEPPDQGMPADVVPFSEVIRRIGEGFRLRTPP
jgi:hypothetical protein